MSRNVAVRMTQPACCALFVLGTFLAPPATLRAQAGTVAGRVTDSAGLAIVGAEVVVVGTGASVTSDERGEFRLTGLRPGPATVRARRLGYRPDSAAVDINEKAVRAISIRLRQAAASLRPVVVRTNRVDYRGRLAGYYERLDSRGNGNFITREQIDRENPRTLSQLLQHAPGMSAFRGRAGLAGVRMRGRQCWPLVWLDGTQMPSGEVDLDGINPNTIQGIELYLGSTSAPVRYTAGRDFSSCGTILLWSRGPDTDPMVSPRSRPWNLEAMIASLSIYTADQVDQPAAPDPSRPIEVSYPPALFAEKIRGSVIAEYVVDATGKVEDDTFGVVSSTHSLFTEAVRQAVAGAVYRPAQKAGRSVRQLVQQPFTFAPKPGGSSGGSPSR